MAKTNGPLMSLSAAGTIGGTITYRVTARKNVAQAQTIRRAKATDPQKATRANFSACITYWKSLDELERQPWLALSLRLRLPPLATIYQEWRRQQCTALKPPLVPA